MLTATTRRRRHGVVWLAISGTAATPRGDHVLMILSEYGACVLALIGDLGIWDARLDLSLPSLLHETSKLPLCRPRMNQGVVNSLLMWKVIPTTSFIPSRVLPNPAFQVFQVWGVSGVSWGLLTRD